jgi:uncharacterized protein (DUF2147 family)
MVRSLILILVLLWAPRAWADGIPTGRWLTQGRDGVIAVSVCGDALCAEIVGVFLDRPDDPMPVDYRGVSQCKLPLITDAREIRRNLWKGHIKDPRNGSVFGVELNLDPHGNLALRGFLGIPLLGQTQIWTRYAGKVPDDCRIVPPFAKPGAVAEQAGRPASRTGRDH